MPLGSDLSLEIHALYDEIELVSELTAMLLGLDPYLELHALNDEMELVSC